MSRSKEPARPDDPDETPTRIGGNSGGSPLPEDDPTVPSMRKGAPPPPPAKQQAPKVNDPLIGKELGGCKIAALLGRGAMGAVYKARQIKLDRDVAVKVIRPEMMTDARTLKRFEVEARTVGRFNSAHVVMVHDVGFEQGVHYLVMEFVQGKNLRDHVKLLAGGRLPAAEAIPLLRQACKGLEEAQRLAVIHRDIKPDNLMLTDRGVLKIADFGIAKPIQEDFSMTLTSELIGTPLYMSPEQCQGAQDLDFRSDMYSLGATFYYLLTGEPPVRASSVYELIQTKTKLENLCLWKALPELDQNHPLSRVIERMTALDRDDRYESYEALLNDIVIVEAGGTVQRLAPKPEKKDLPKLPEAPVRKGKGGLVAAAVAVVALGAGGYWFATRPGGTNAAGGGVVGPAKLDPALVKGQLRDLRDRLQNQGPTASLRDDVQKIGAEGADAAEKQTLLAAVQQGLGVQERLAKVKTPDAVEPPFDVLRTHFAAVETAAKVEGTLSPLLQKWLGVAVKTARAEDTLGAKAVARLAGAFTKWNGERAKAGGDKGKIAQLTEQLATIESSRRTLMDLVPGVRADLDRDLPVENLDKARRGLTENTSVATDVDVSAQLARLAAEFDKNGPDASLARQVDELHPTRVDQDEAQKQLIKAIGAADDRKSDALRTKTSAYPTDPQLPFDDVGSYFQKIDIALDPLRDAQTKKLPPWADALRGSLRDEKVLQGKVVAACAAAFTAWQKAAAEPGADGDRMAQRLAAISAGKARAAALFAGATAELDHAVPAAEIEKANAGVAQAAGKQRWLGTTKQLQARLDALRTLADWRAAEKQLGDDVAANDAAAGVFGGDAEVQREQKRIDETRSRWATADAKMKELAGKIADGDLTGAEAVARATSLGAEGKDELALFRDAAGRCREAFAGLDQGLDVGKAAKALADAKAVLAPVASLAPAVDQRIARWSASLDALQQASAGMAVIAGGRVRQAPNRIESFFLSPTETSHAEFTRFLGELRDTVKGIDDPAKRLAAVAPRLPGIGLTADSLASILEIEPRQVDPKSPADRLTWYAAAAFAVWYGRALPTFGEWALASFGDGNKQQYSFGAPWDSPQRDCVCGVKNLAAVDDGGLCWRQGEGPRIHHLAGNVAEWLAADPAATEAQLAGGKYNDSEPRAKEQAEGNAYTADKGDGRQGFGVRTVLRPRSFPGLDWPR